MRGVRPFLRTRPRPTGGGGVRGAILLLALAAAAPAADGPAWTTKVPDFRSSWPEPLAVGSAAPEFSLRDLDGRSVTLAKTRAGKKAVLVLFVDDSCGTARRRAPDLSATLTKTLAVDGAGAIVVFPRNLSGKGEKGMRAFAGEAKFPAVPLLRDDDGERAAVTLAWHVPVTPCAVVLDGKGEVAYFGLALPPSGADLLPAVVAAVAAGKAPDGPAVRPPYG
jgi:peroxiredoxin